MGRHSFMRTKILFVMRQHFDLQSKHLCPSASMAPPSSHCLPSTHCDTALHHQSQHIMCSMHDAARCCQCCDNPGCGALAVRPEAKCPWKSQMDGLLVPCVCDLHLDLNLKLYSCPAVMTLMVRRHLQAAKECNAGADMHRGFKTVNQLLATHPNHR